MCQNKGSSGTGRGAGLVDHPQTNERRARSNYFEMFDFGVIIEVGIINTPRYKSDIIQTGAPTIYFSLVESVPLSI